MKPATAHLADWVHAVTEVPARGLTRERAASAAEREQLAADLKIVSIGRLVAIYRISSLAGGGWRLAGRLDADVVQSCIVTLEPVADTISEDFDAEFRDSGETSDPAGELTVLEGPEIEPLIGGEIPAGRIVIETLSAALDPYPRHPGAEFGWTETGDTDNKKTSPFAVLAKLKKNE